MSKVRTDPIVLLLLFYLDMARRGRRKTITNFLEIADVVLLRRLVVEDYRLLALKTASLQRLTLRHAHSISDLSWYGESAKR